MGLGLPNYHTIDLNRRRFNDAVRASEELLIEQVDFFFTFTLTEIRQIYSFAKIICYILTIFLINVAKQPEQKQFCVY